MARRAHKVEFRHVPLGIPIIPRKFCKPEARAEDTALGYKTAIKHNSDTVCDVRRAAMKKWQRNAADMIPVGIPPGAEFLFLDFEESGSGEGGYAAPSSPEFREKQLELFRAQAPEVDIVITTALIPGRPAPKLWLEDMVAAMKTGSVVVDLAAERGGNCDLTVKDEKIVSDNGVTVVGYTDFPSRMAAQSSELYSTNIRHLLTDLTPEKDGVVDHNMDDDVIRGATIAHAKDVTFPPPPPKIQAIAAQPKAAVVELTAEEKRAAETAAFKAQTKNQVILLGFGPKCFGDLVGNRAVCSVENVS